MARKKKEKPTNGSPCETCEFVQNCGWGWGDYDSTEEPPCDVYLTWWALSWNAAKRGFLAVAHKEEAANG